MVISHSWAWIPRWITAVRNCVNVYSAVYTYSEQSGVVAVIRLPTPIITSEVSTLACGPYTTLYTIHYTLHCTLDTRDNGWGLVAGNYETLDIPIQCRPTHHNHRHRHMCVSV